MAGEAAPESQSETSGMSFREFSKNRSVPDLERETLEFWEEHDTFQKSVKNRAGSPRFVFYEGPPTANGHPGAHHVLARTIKDIVCRYKTMKGFLVERKAGWDTHGLPVEIEVEKELSLDGKDDIERFGVARFVEKSRASVFRYKDEWDQLTRRMGYWIDLSDPYITCTNEYVESVWHLLKLMWEKGLIYKGHKILPYCPRCGTPLSSHEVAQGYADAEDPSVFVKMRIADRPGAFFLVWTTTPWTLISNVALAVAPDEEYVSVKQGDETLILANALLSVVDGDYEVVDRVRGQELVGTRYEPLYSFVPFEERAHYIIGAGFVTLEDGTGIVHIAPAFGEDDYNVGKERNLPLLQPVDGAGRFTDEVTPWAGMFIKDADPSIMDDLESRGLLYKKGTVVHTYPFCWRCESPLLYYARSSWYIRTTDFKDEMIRNNAAIDWHPKEIGSNRLGDWLENNVDWAISRDRYWGTPLNIWICDSCGSMDAIGGIAELRERAVNGLTGELDLHKPMVDGVLIRCRECGGTMTRTPEVVDCWFDTGSMPYAQWHWPFENKEAFETHFPADFIAEGVDQTRGWFYSLLAISTIVSGVSSFKRCVSNEMVLDKAGKKMSKSVGNVADSWDHMEREGADALRWYLMSTSPPWVPTRFDAAGVREVASKVVGTFDNAYSFFSLYANIDGYDPSEHFAPLSRRPAIDRWIISRLHSTVFGVERDMDAYDITKGLRLLQNFILEDLSNWYVRVSRSRFWKGDMDEDKISAYSTLYDVLQTTARAIAPFAPFLSERVYLRLRGTGAQGSAGSIHLCSFPDALSDLVDTALESSMHVVRSVVALGRAARNEAGIKVRQPLARALVAGVPEPDRPGVEALKDLVLSELNVKKLDWSSVDDLVTRRATPVFSSLGPKHGKNVNEVARQIEALDAGEVDCLACGRSVQIAAADGAVTIEPADVAIKAEPKPGLGVQAEGSLAVAIETSLTDDLLDEGFAREMINKIQYMRKQAGFDVMDRINVYYAASPRLESAISSFVGRIAAETLAESVCEDSRGGDLRQDWDINGERASIAVERVRRSGSGLSLGES